MEKIIGNDMRGTDKAEILGQWGSVDSAIIKFQNNCTLGVFEFIFEKGDATRLWKHLKLDCDNNFQKFRTYLTVSQFNDLLANVYYNQNMYYL